MASVKVPAAHQTLQILSLLARSRGPMPASMIAAQLNLPRSTVYHLLTTLQEHGYVLHLAEEKRYGLGIAAVELSSAYARHEPLSRVGRPLIAALVDRISMSAHLAVPHGRDVLYVIEERAPGSPALVSDVDVRLPMPLTASGRAILAALPKAQVRALFPDRGAFVLRHVPSRADSDGAAEIAAASAFAGDQAAESAGDLARVSASTDADADGSAGAGIAPSLDSGPRGAEILDEDGIIDRYTKLRTVLDATTTRGFALERGSVTPGFSSVAVPVLDHRKWPVAAIAVTFRDGDLEASAYTPLVSEVRRVARTLSSRIYGRAAR